MSKRSTPPNILFILSDQHRYDAVGVNGNDICRTAHIDRLAGEGMRFSHAFTPCALCSPTRASIITGRYPHNHKVLTNVHDHHTALNLSQQEISFAELLLKHGYRTGYSGKWHVGQTSGPERYGFQDVYTRIPAPREQSKAKPTVWESRRSDETFIPMPYAPLVLAGRLEEPLETMQESEALRHGLEFLKGYAEGGQDGSREFRPFFLRVDFLGPHLPCVVPEPYASMYSPEDIPPDPTFADNLEGKPWIQADMVRRWGVDKLSWQDWQKVRARYYGYITLVDDCIGRLLAELEHLGLADDTLVLYSTDHGDACGSRRMVDKGYCGYEEQYRIPLVARWPGVIRSGTVSDSFVNLVDLAPTFLEAAGCSLPQQPRFDGRSIVPLLQGNPPADWPEYTVGEFHGMQWGLYSQRILRSRRYKLVFNLCDQSELYDLETDPWELDNVYELPEYRKTREELFGLLLQWMEHTWDPFISDVFCRRAYDPSILNELRSTGRHGK